MDGGRVRAAVSVVPVRAQEKTPHRRVGAEADGALARRPRRRDIALGGGEVRERGPVRLVAVDVLGRKGRERGTAGRSAVGGADGAGAADDRADRRPDRDQRVVEATIAASGTLAPSRRCVCADWIAASSWNAPGAASAAARCSAASPMPSSSRSQSDVSCASSGT